MKADFFPRAAGLVAAKFTAAITAGIAALLFEWGIVNGNKPAMYSDLIRSYLISGCQRESNLTYPNIQWGFGKVNLYGTFEVIKESAVDFNTMIEGGDFSQ